MAGTNQTAAWWLGRKIGVKMQPSDGAVKPIFYGRVYSVNIQAEDQTAETVRVTLGLQSPLAEYSGYLVTQTRPAEAQNLRLFGLVDDAEDISWIEVGLNVTWYDVDPDTTWANYRRLEMPGISLSDINTDPMIAYTPIDAPFDDVMYQYAINNNGFFGDLIYFARHQTNGVTYISYYTFPESWSNPVDIVLDMNTRVVSNETTANLNLSDIYNYVEATNGTVTRSFENSASITQYGLRPLILDTDYSLTNDIDDMVAQRATGRSTPIQALSSVTVDYDLLSDGARIPFIGEHKVVSMINVPTAFGTDQKYIVRGMTLNVSYYHADATWQIVPQQMLAYFTPWYLIPGTTIWTTYTTQTWADIT